MHPRSSVRPWALACALLGMTAEWTHAAEARLPEVTVTGTRESAPLIATPAAVGVIPEDTVRAVRPAHPAQLLGQIPGVGVAVTNGEGHTTAIRQPFTTQPVYLFLEDGIPVRSTGFFNHNALYETNVPQSGGVEVTRGPGTALYGSDAIGGIVNVLTRKPPASPAFSASAELGAYGFQRLLVGGGSAYAAGGWRADVNVTHTDGWRAATGYDRRSATLRWDHALDAAALLKTVLAVADIDQQTGANSPLTRADYTNDPRRNYLPIAFRRVQAFRLSTTYEREHGPTLLTVTPYVRDNGMDLLASFTLSADPTVYTEENRSYGLVAKWRRDFPDFMHARLIIGADVDVSPGSRREDSLAVTTSGSAPARVFSAYTVARRVYDYDVTFRGVSPYVHAELSPVAKLRLMAGLRYDRLGYEFRNRLGTTTIAVPGGVFPSGTRYYGQAGDTDLTFEHWSPKLGASYALTPDTHLYGNYSHGFRAPSQSNLFRPAIGSTAAAAQTAARSALALKPIRADQFELGLRGRLSTLEYDFVAYDLTKRDDIVAQRDPVSTLTQVVNAGRTSHRGVELGLGLPLAATWRADVATSYAVHRYEQWVTTAGVFSGKEMESAPRVLTNARLTWAPRTRASVQAEWVRLGRYWLDAANTQRYDGHDLVNVRTTLPLAKDAGFFASIYNLGNRRYADSAQLSANQPVLSPGLPRTLYAGLELTWR